MGRIYKLHTRTNKTKNYDINKILNNYFFYYSVMILHGGRGIQILGVW